MARRLLWLAAILAILLVTHSFWLPLAARPLVHDDGPQKADIAVVLAGDAHGRRILFAADLVRQGLVPKVLVSGPEMYGVYESDLSIAMAVRQGFPRESFEPLNYNALSTRDEASLVIPELRRRGVRSFLLVTSDFHTARAGRIFGRATGDITMKVVAAPDRFFKADTWWKTREGQKIVFIEWLKTVATAVGM